MNVGGARRELRGRGNGNEDRGVQITARSNQPQTWQLQNKDFSQSPAIIISFVDVNVHTLSSTHKPLRLKGTETSPCDSEDKVEGERGEGGVLSEARRDQSVQTPQTPKSTSLSTGCTGGGRL